jgi:peptidoglycan/xylan/chitin deacetylase (PgdA/CDA1 family)
VRLLSPVLHRILYPALGSIGFFHSHPAAGPHVITYHGVLPAGYGSADSFLDNTLVSAETFRSHLRLLKKHYEVISPEAFLVSLREGRALHARAIMLTCDDGLLNHVTTMLPILQEEQLKCLFFVTGSSAENRVEMLWYVELYLLLMRAERRSEPTSVQGIGIPQIPFDPRERRSVWLRLVKELSSLDADTRRAFLDEAREKLGMPSSWKLHYLEDRLLSQRFRLMGSGDLKQLVDAGMTVGAHSMSHPALIEQSEDLARSEIANCRMVLEQALGQPVWAIAYPFGNPESVSAREYKLAEEAGYECAFINIGGTLDPESRRFALPRIHVSAEMSLSVYEAYVSGFHDALRIWLRPQPRDMGPENEEKQSVRAQR